MLDIDPLYEIGADSPYLLFEITDYTTWPEYKGLPDHHKRIFDRAVDVIAENPGTTVEELKLDHGINTNILGGVSIIRKAAGVNQSALESQYLELEAEAVRFALSFGPDNVTIPDLKSRGFMPVISPNHHGSVYGFRRHVRENNFNGNGYLISDQGLDLTE